MLTQVVFVLSPNTYVTLIDIGDHSSQRRCVLDLRNLHSGEQADRVLMKRLLVYNIESIHTRRNV